MHGGAYTVYGHVHNEVQIVYQNSSVDGYGNIYLSVLIIKCKFCYPVIMLAVLPTIYLIRIVNIGHFLSKDDLV